MDIVSAILFFVYLSKTRRARTEVDRALAEVKQALAEENQALARVKRTLVEEHEKNHKHYMKWMKIWGWIAGVLWTLDIILCISTFSGN